MLRKLMVAAACWALSVSGAVACSGQAGTTVFEDNFADDSGGWDMSGGTKYVDFKNGVMLLHPNALGLKDQNSNMSVQNLTFSATDGDYCLEFILPKPVAADNNVVIGLMFLRQDNGSKFIWEASTDKGVYLYKLAGGTWSPIYSNNEPSPPVKLEPNAVNSLRVLVKDGKLTLFLNDQQIKVVRVQIPPGEQHFGVYTQADKVSDQNPSIQIKSFKVTTGQ